MFYTVGEAAKKMGVTPSALRYYDKEGLLPFVERSGSGMRMFNVKDLEWLKIIECLKKTGMPIKDIKTYMNLSIEGDSTIEQRLSIIIKQQKAIETQIAAMEKTLEIIKYKRWYYEVAKEAGTLSVHDTMNPDSIPEDIKNVKQELCEAE